MGGLPVRRLPDPVRRRRAAGRGVAGFLSEAGGRCSGRSVGVLHISVTRAGTAAGEDPVHRSEDFADPYAQILHDWYGGARRRGSYVGTAWQAFADSLDGVTQLPQADNPAFDRGQPEDLQIGTVEALWAPIAEADDWHPLHEKVEAIRRWGEMLRG